MLKHKPWQPDLQQKSPPAIDLSISLYLGKEAETQFAYQNIFGYRSVLVAEELKVPCHRIQVGYLFDSQPSRSKGPVRERSRKEIS